MIIYLSYGWLGALERGSQLHVSCLEVHVSTPNSPKISSEPLLYHSLGVSLSTNSFLSTKHTPKKKKKGFEKIANISDYCKKGKGSSCCCGFFILLLFFNLNAQWSPHIHNQKPTNKISPILVISVSNSHSIFSF